MSLEEKIQKPKNGHWSEYLPYLGPVITYYRTVNGQTSIYNTWNGLAGFTLGIHSGLYISLLTVACWEVIPKLVH